MLVSWAVAGGFHAPKRVPGLKGLGPHDSTYPLGKSVSGVSGASQSQD
jgi:hypothetical protein